MSQQIRHREETRERILESAQRQFGQNGFSAVSIDEVMEGAGLTRGGFYSYFDSKTELYAEAVKRVAREKLRDGRAAENASHYAIQVIREYLSMEHYEGSENSCPLLALPTDLCRTDPTVRAAFESALGVLIEILERGFLPENNPQARQRTLAMASLMVGSMILARGVDSRELSDDLRQAALATALDLGRVVA
jgi:TetR/AcrR family transcriptional regulator, transcriptional repressor for nem operon